MDGLAARSDTESNNKKVPWIIWGISAFFVFFQFLLQASPSVMIPELMQSFAIDVTQVGFLSSFYYYTYVILQMPAGILADQLGARRLLIIGLIGLSFACFMFAVTQQFLGVLTARLMMGIFASPGIVCVLYLARHWFPANKFALLAGLTETLGMMGAAVGEPILSEIVSLWNWRGAMYTCVATAVLVNVAVFFYVKDKPQKIKNETTQTTQRSEKNSLLVVLKQVLLCRNAWILGLYTGLMFTIVATFAALWCVPYVRQLYQVTLTSATSLTALVFIGTAVGAPLLGCLADQFGAHKGFMIVGAITTSICLLLILFIPVSLFVMGILLFLVGFLSSTYMLPYSVMSALMPKSMLAAAMGYTNMMCLIFGAPLLQPAVGWLLEYRHAISNDVTIQMNYVMSDYQFALSTLLVCTFIAFLLSLFVPGKQTESEKVIVSKKAILLKKPVRKIEYAIDL